ncbi:hypothetical protein LguiA_012881 [Lonicera macranthoides]
MRSKVPLPFLLPFLLLTSKGNLPAIKLNEEVYQKVVQACTFNLIGRFTLPKGSRSLKTSDLYSKLNARWSIKNGFKFTPIGRGFLCLRFKHQDDQNQAWLNGHLNLKPGIFRLQPWQKDFNPDNQKLSNSLIWVEVDLLHTLHHKLLIEREGYSFEVNVTYENLTKFCMHCHIIGHLVGECNSLKKVQEEAIRYNQQQHSSHDPSTVNARKNKQHLVPILGTKPSVSASNPTTVARNNQKSQLQPVTTATDSLADQNGVVTGVESKDSMPSNTVMALNEVFGAHSPSSYHIQSPSHKLDSPHNDSIASTSHSSKHAKANHHNTSSFEESFVPCSVSLKQQNLKTNAKAMLHITSFYTQHTSTPHNSFKNKSKFKNQIVPISDLYWDGDGDGEN